MLVRAAGVLAGTLAAVVVLSGSGSRPPLGLDLYRPIPETNPQTAPKIALGRRLFHDRRWSRDGRVSCATCHDPRHAFADNRALAVGAGQGVGRRNVPTIVNRVWGRSFFWDGRATSLEQQALQPILNPLELGATADAVVALARSRDYGGAFRTVFGRIPDLADVARALASYVRTIMSGDSAYDRYVAGNRSALRPAARRGLALFNGQAGCATCHSGPIFTDELFHNTGVAWRSGAPSDLGRSAMTGREEDRGAFKTPTLREVARTAPYMHDGSLATIEEVVEFYDRGGKRNPHIDDRLRPLGLTRSQRADLVAFLNALNGRIEEGR